MKFLPAQNRDRLFYLSAAVIVLAGLVLRIFAAGGDLTQDEITSVNLVAGIHHAGQVFWGINNDNNHYLNSLWLFWVGGGASVFLMRLPAIIMGTLTIAAIGLLQVKRGRLVALTSMLLFALSYEMVNYGSLARGYAGLMLFTVMALYYVEEILVGHERRWALAMMVLFGLLSHLNMMFSLLAMVGYVCFVEAKRQADVNRAVSKTLGIFAPAFFAIAPLIALISFIVFSRQFTLGGKNPFDFLTYINSYGMAIQGATNIPFLNNPRLYVLITAFIISLYHFIYKNDYRNCLLASALIGVPAAIIFLQVPNPDQPRYSLLSATIWLMLTSEIISKCWLKPKAISKIFALAVMFILVLGNYVFLQKFFTYGRDHYQQAVAIMTSHGPATYGLDSINYRFIVSYYARESGKTATYIPFTQWCETPPEWLIIVSYEHGSSLMKTMLSPLKCPVVFDAPQVFPYFGMTGVQWTLYHRASP